MALLIILTLALLAGSCCSTSTSRIINGESTTIEKYPSLVQVEFREKSTGIWSQSCAASVLNSRYVLSAAHCFSGMMYSPDQRRIRAGTTYRNHGGTIVDIEKENNHPSFDPSSFDGDISVVRLSSALQYTTAIQRSTIIGQGAVISDNMPVIHAGWGDTSEGVPSNVLLEAIVYTINTELCRQHYNDMNINITDNMVCAGLLNVGGRGFCERDDGGPLYYSNIVVGVISWGVGCANGTYPGVSTKVASYSNWIVSTAV